MKSLMVALAVAAIPMGFGIVSAVANESYVPTNQVQVADMPSDLPTPTFLPTPTELPTPSVLPTPSDLPTPTVVPIRTWLPPSNGGPEDGGNGGGGGPGYPSSKKPCPPRHTCSSATPTP